jgi:hypothetical protein
MIHDRTDSVDQISEHTASPLDNVSPYPYNDSMKNILLGFLATGTAFLLGIQYLASLITN